VRGFRNEYWRERDASAEFPHDFFQAIAKAGYLSVAIFERYGGGGLGITEAALVLREVAASGAAVEERASAGVKK
jgi:acyl-CoA dehydrogenase